MSTETVRRTIKDTTFEVINSEFINEFESIMINIREIVNSFNKCSQIIPFEKVAKILSTLDFKYASGIANAGVNDKI
ncbi:MAG TPA: hypothetical protein VEF04_05160, partial [Blastocatellia bacterium]|nr:hypothetical protein [Blastocatellia bacterium]